ncbi:MAG: stage III sporulation protein AF [Hungatella hathewayi]|uniref:stage III sporulation protein AF n=1 Tax=Hungatella TaxID=1649459 RepID=UPI001105EA0E|nr:MULTISPECIES: stage III sporulation protein AF [Hungatella]MCI7382158.1 stage III sporulation protein AF [Hungatella sp.]MDY6237557.1 stage III sporulation protein AF [Hungatella hathewayi]
MEGIYEWIRNITYYLIFMTVVTNLLPDKKYEKYFRLFAGMVLILLVLKPFTGGLRLDDKLAYYFEAISFQKEASELSAQISDMESVRLKSMVSQYEEAVEHDLRTMAESSGFVCVKAKALIDGDEKNARFGHVVSVSLRLAPDSPGQTDQGNNTKIRPVESVEPVERIRVELGGGSTEVSETAGERNPAAAGAETGTSAGEITKPAGASAGQPDHRQEENSALAGLRRRISEYYDLEEQDIEIQLEIG